MSLTLISSNDVNDILYLNISVPHEIEIWGQRHSLGPLQLTHRGSLGQTKGHKRDKKGKNSRWWKFSEKWIWHTLMYFISHLFSIKNWKLPQSMRTRDLNKLYWAPKKRQNTANVKIGSNYWSIQKFKLFLYKKKTCMYMYVSMYIRNITTTLHYLSNFNQRWKHFGFSFGRAGRIRSIITHPLH